MGLDPEKVQDELGIYFAEQKKSETLALRNSLSLASTHKPDEAAKVSKLSKASGIPTNLVELNQKEFERQERVSADKMALMVETYPLLSKQLSNPEFAKVSHDETDNLSWYEATVKTVGDAAGLGRSFIHGAVGEGVLGSGLEGLGMNITNYWKLASLAPEVFLGLGGTIGKFAGVDFDPTEAPGEKVEAAGAAVREFSEEHIKPEGEATKPRQVAGGVGQGLSQIAAMLIPGGQSAALSLMIGQGTKAQSDKIERDSPDAPEILKVMEELTGGFITGATEAVTNKFMIGLGKAKVLSPEINLLKSKFLGYTGRILLGATSEAIQETAENVFQDLAHIAFTTPEGKIQWNEAVESGEVGGWVGGIMTGILQAAFHIKGSRFRNSIAEVNDAAKVQKLKERSPDDFNSFGETLAKHLADTSNGSVETLYIDREAFAQSILDSGSNPEDVAKVIPGVGEQYIETGATGGDIAIRMEDYLGKIAGTEIGDAISPHVRATPESLSITEQKTDVPEIANQIAEQAKLVTESQADQKAFEESAREVEKNIFTQLKDAGNFSNTVNRAYAKFTSNFYTTLAGKYGLTPSEMYEKIPYKVKGSDGVTFDSATVLSQPSIDLVRDSFAQRTLESSETEESVKDIENKWEDRITNISLFEDEKTIDLNTIIIPKEDRKKGLGSEIINDIISYADRVGKKIELTPAVKDDFQGTTSRSRLVKFYKRFGFVENKGRNKDFTINAGKMFRLPKADPNIFGQQALDPIQTAEFKEWSEGGEVVEGHDIDDHDFKQDEPVVLKVFHGTTHKFSVFEAEQQGNLEGHFGAINYFTSDEGDAGLNYGGEGPDLTNRIEQRSEQIVNELEDQGQEDIQALADEHGLEFDPESETHPGELPNAMATAELSGGEDQTLELFVKVKNPFVIGENAEWIEFIDNEEVQELAFQEVADSEVLSVEEVKERAEEFEDQIDEARWNVENDTEHLLVEAINTVSQRHGIDASNLAGEVYDLGEEARPKDIDALLRQSRDYQYAEGEEGEIIGSQLVAEVIQEMGFDSIVLKNAEETFPGMGMGSGTTHVHIFDSNKTNIKSIENVGTFDPADPDIFKQDLRGAFDPAQLTTLLNKKADFSTFLHETSHFYLEAYTRLANEPDAPQEIKDDMKTVLDWYGVESMEEWTGMSVSEQRKFHEQFAHNFEIYLAEGKAPSTELQSIFDRFAAWLRAVYADIRGELNNLYRRENGVDLPILNKDVTQVMDRMIASEDQIKQIEAVRNMEPLFQTQEESGMSDEDWDAYVKSEEETHNVSVRELQNATVKQIKWLENAKTRVMKKLQKTARETRAKVRVDVERVVAEEPVYKATRWLKKGELTTPGEDVKVDDGNKLSIPELKKMYDGRESLVEIPDYTKLGYGPHGMLANDGLPPDMVGEMFGFESGDRLVRSLLDAKPFKEEVEDRTDQVMLEKFSPLSSKEEMEIQVNKAVNTKARAKFVAVELNHLSKSLKPVRIMNKAAQVAAEQMIGGKLIKDIKVGAFNSAAAKASRNAESAMKKGDTQAAVNEKQKQLLNIHLARESTKAREKVDKSIKLYKKIFKPDKKLAKSRDMNFVSSARAILANYGIGPKGTSADVFLENIEKYDPELMVEIGPMITAHRVDSKNYRDMPFNAFLDMHDQVDALWHLSKRSKQMLIDGKVIDRNEAVEQLVGRAVEIGLPENRKGYKSDMSDWDKRKIMLLAARASLRRTESWVSAMDGADTGPYRKYIWQPISEAVSEFRIAKIDYLEKYMKAVKIIEKDLTGSKVDGDEIGYVFKDKTTLIHAILHTGNESNKRKLLLGRGWGTLNEDGTVNDTNWNRFINRMHREGILTKKDYDFAQSIWDLLETMKPDSQKVHREMYGFYFNEITADPLNTPFGEYKGGYVPAVTDPYIVTDSAIRNEQETQQTDNSFMFPTTGRGFTKGRVEYNEPLMLDLGFLPAHIDRVLRFTHIEPRIKDVARVVKNSKVFSESIDRLDPTIRTDMLIPWLQRTAQQMVQTPMKSKLLHKLFSELRTRTGMNLMVGNLTNAIQQFTGFTISMLKVKPKHLRNGIWTYATNPIETTEMITAKSKFMNTRMSSYQFEINKHIEEMLVNPSKYDKLREFTKKHGYFLQAGFQSVVDTATWIGGYNQKMEETGDEIESVRFADSTVRETQGSFAPEDISRFETGTAFSRAFTMFYSYFNMGANLLGTEFAKTMRSAGLRDGAGRLLYVYTLGFMAPAVLSEMLVQGLGGFDTGDDDDFEMWDAISLFFSSQARTLAAFIPIAGPATMAGINTWNSKPYDDRMSTSPAVSALEATLRSPNSLYKAINDRGSWKRAAKDFLTAIGLVAGLPVGQLGKPIGFALDIEQGKSRPKSDLDFVRGIISGKDVNRRQ